MSEQQKTEDQIKLEQKEEKLTKWQENLTNIHNQLCLLYTSPSPRD